MLAIIGAGIAGSSCAIYAKRAGLEFSIFEPKAVGGQLLFIEKIENYIGVEKEIKGADLVKRIIDAFNNLGIKVRNEKIIKIEIKDKDRVVNLFSEKASYTFKGVVIATGASFKKLNVTGEDKFLGRGVSYCAVCDGFFFKGKEVAVVGGGNSACEEAIYLSKIANKVFLIHRRDRLRAIDYLQKELFNKKNIQVIFNKVVKEIKGEDFVKEVILEDVVTKKATHLSLDGIFIAIGMTPNTEIFKNIVSLDKNGFIITDENMKTSCDFVWACGDCRRRPLRQLITAASEGAIAALSAYKYLKSNYISV
jgi:thioredoxin reductase (NADPH)